MFKNRLFLYGLGLGLIITSIIMELNHFTEKSLSVRTSNEHQEWLGELFEDDIQTIKNTAQENGYQVVLNEEIESIRNKARTEVEEIMKKLEEQKQIKEDPILITSFIISAGMGSTEVVKQLKELELINNEDEFMQELKDKQLNTKIQAGMYRFEGKPLTADIIKEITKDNS